MGMDGRRVTDPGRGRTFPITHLTPFWVSWIFTRNSFNFSISPAWDESFRFSSHLELELFPDVVVESSSQFPPKVTGSIISMWGWRRVEVRRLLASFRNCDLSVVPRSESRKEAHWILGTISIILVTSPLYTSAVPISIKKGEPFGIANNSVLEYKTVSTPSDSVCRYRATSYLAGDEVPTDEPCLRCQCKKQAVVCKLRICTEPVPDAPPPGCVVVQKANSCCPKLVCPETRKITREREQRLSTGNHKNETQILAGISSLPQHGFCAHEGTIYAEGSAMRSSTPCDNCFCIRGEMKCSRPQCVIPLKGCKPRYRSFACCPTNYDCSESNTSAIIQSASAIPQFLKGCRVAGRFVYEGEPILPIHLDPNSKEHLCQSCFCLGGLVRCRPLECSRPIAGCEPVTEDGHCCPSSYSCPNTTITITIGAGTEKVNSTSVSPETPKGEPHFQDFPTQLLEPKNSTPPPENGSAHPSPTVAVEGSSEFLSNKLKSDVGSREERRNKDAREGGDAGGNSKASYEDDERDYNFGVPSLESVEHELIAKMTFLDGEEGESAWRESGIKGKGAIEDGSQNEIMLETTTTTTTTTAAEKEVKVAGFSFGRMEEQEPRGTLQNGNMTGIGRNSTTPQTSNGEEGIHQSLKSGEKSNISSLLTTFESDILPSSVLPVLLPPSPPPPPPAPLPNLQFIPFGVEDARLLSPLLGNNETGTNVGNLEQEMIIPPKNNPAIGPGPKVVRNPAGVVIPVPKPPPVDKFRNVIMDVPVSTSLYNNGFYRHGIITTAPDLNSSRFPGQVFEDSGEILGGGGLPILNVGQDAPIFGIDGESSPPSKISNPSRTYSKFGILDSPSYRHETGNENSKIETSILLRDDDEGRGDYDPSDPIYDEDEGTLESFEEKEGGNEFPISSPPHRNETLKPIIITTSIPTRKENNHPTTTTTTTTDRIPPHHHRNFKPIVAFPFKISQNPRAGAGSLGLKLSGCNIYGKMYTIGNVIRELSGPCVECECTEIGVQCLEISC